MAFIHYRRILAGFMVAGLFAATTLANFKAAVQDGVRDFAARTPILAPAPENIRTGISWDGPPGILQTIKGSKTNLQTTAPTQAAIIQPASRPVATGSFPELSFTFTATPLQGEVINSQVHPPDTMGAVGPTQFVMMINGLGRVFDKDTGLPNTALDFNPDLFFKPVLTPVAENSTNSTRYPRVRYDRFSGRWILLVSDLPGGVDKQSNRVLLAVSAASTITPDTAWSLYSFQPGNILYGQGSNQINLFTEYPTLGLDAHALYIGLNLYSTGQAKLFFNSAGFVIKKSSIINNGPLKGTGFQELVEPDGQGLYSPQGVDNYDPAPATGYFIGLKTPANNNRLYLRRVYNPGSNTPTLSANISIPIDDLTQPIPVQHKGNTGDSPQRPNRGKLDPVNNRFSNAVIRTLARGNGLVETMWLAHHIGVDVTGSSNTNTITHNGSRWYELINLTTTPDLGQSGTVFDPTSPNPQSYWVPSIAISGQGHALMGFNAAGPDAYVNAAFVGRLAGDPAGFMHPLTRYTATNSAYNPPVNDHSPINRLWSEYSYTSLDPVDDMTFWTIQQVAFNNGTPNTEIYGIQVAKIKAPPPATPLPLGPALTPGLKSFEITISGNPVNGSGFFEPGPWSTNHLKVDIDGEIIINKIVSVTPTSIVLNVSTLFATTGLHSVTITNPDGQSVTGKDIINVSNYNCTQMVSNTASDGSEGSFSQVLTNARTGGCKNIVLGTLDPIRLTGSLAALPAGVTITTNKSCDAGKVEIVRSPGNVFSGDGLSLNGGTFFGLAIHGFNGKQLVVLSGDNRLKCISTAQT